MTHVHFIGAGGVGMAGLAHISADLKMTVTGSDAVDSGMLASLRERGLDMAVGHREGIPGTPDLVVVSSAVPKDDPEYSDAVKRGIPVMRRGEYLGEIARKFDKVVAISGSHGKTSTTAMLAHILKVSGHDPGYMVGGFVNGWERSAGAGRGKILVTEVDESDGTQVFVHADIGVVMNIEDDHCWSHGGVEALERCFVAFAEEAKAVIAWDTASTRRLLGRHPDVLFLSEGDIPSSMALPIPGHHWRCNGTVAIAVAERCGVSRGEAIAALASFPGVSRRMSIRSSRSDESLVLLEDYAHHPTELGATLQAIGEGYPRHRVIVVFQPHRFERVKRYGAQFSALLSGTEHAWVVQPFAAWVADGADATPESIAANITDGRGEYIANSPEQIATAVSKYLSQKPATCASPVVLAVIGAGDVTKVISLLEDNLC